jgi:hypothetical protein
MLEAQNETGAIFQIEPLPPQESVPPCEAPSCSCHGKCRTTEAHVSHLPF